MERRPEVHNLYWKVGLRFTCVKGHLAEMSVDLCTIFGDGNPGDAEPNPDPVVFVSLNDHAVHTALGLPGATVGRHATDPYESSYMFAAHFLDVACVGAHANHAVIKDPQPHLKDPGIDLWSQAVEAAQLKPLGHRYCLAAAPCPTVLQSYFP